MGLSHLMQFRASANTNALRQLSLEIAALPKSIEQDVLDVASDYEDAVEKELGTVPRQARHPFAFATEKSKRWYFWQVSLGNIPTDGSRYVRQGKTPYGWRVDVETDSNGAVIRISNTWDKSKYVYGTLAYANYDTRVQGHRKTGWELASPKAQGLAKRMGFALQDKIKARIKKL